MGICCMCIAVKREAAIENIQRSEKEKNITVRDVIREKKGRKRNEMYLICSHKNYYNSDGLSEEETIHSGISKKISRKRFFEDIDHSM